MAIYLEEEEEKKGLAVSMTFMLFDPAIARVYERMKRKKFENTNSI